MENMDNSYITEYSSENILLSSCYRTNQSSNYYFCLFVYYSWLVHYLGLMVYTIRYPPLSMIDLNAVVLYCTS